MPTCVCVLVSADYAHESFGLFRFLLWSLVKTYCLSVLNSIEVIGSSQKVMPPEKKPKTDQEEPTPHEVIKEELEVDNASSVEDTSWNVNDGGDPEEEKGPSEEVNDDDDAETTPIVINIVKIEAICESSSDDESFPIPTNFSPPPSEEPRFPRRGRGRPPGSKSKLSSPPSEEPRSRPSRRGRGRPPGSKNLKKPKLEYILDSVISLDEQVKQCISECVESGQDPCTTQQFYSTVAKTISHGLAAQIIGEKDVDRFWLKYDTMAAKVLSKISISKATKLANDISLQPPKPKATTSQMRQINNFMRAADYVCQNLILAAAESNRPIRKNLTVRRNFYEAFGNAPACYEPALNFYWNALVNRDPSVYYGAKVGSLVPHGTVPGSLVTRARLDKALKELPGHERVFDPDRYVKLTINVCVWENSDPRSRHIFYVAGSQALRVSGLDESKWEEWYGWAKEAYQKRQEFLIAREQYHFVEVLRRDKPKAFVGPTKGRGPRERFNDLMDQLVKEFAAAGKPKGQDDLKSRLEFYEKYGKFVPADDVGDEVPDEYWKKLERESYLNQCRMRKPNITSSSAIGTGASTGPSTVVPNNPSIINPERLNTESILTARPVSHIIPRTVSTQLRISLSDHHQRDTPKQLIISHGRDSPVYRVIQL